MGFVKTKEDLPKPMRHQLVSLKHDEKNDVVFDTSDAGTGKTAIRIWGFQKRRKKGSGCLLVIATKSLLENAWAKDLRRFAPDLTYSIARAENRAQAFEAHADAQVHVHAPVCAKAVLLQHGRVGEFIGPQQALGQRLRESQGDVGERDHLLAACAF